MSFFALPFFASSLPPSLPPSLLLVGGKALVELVALVDGLGHFPAGRRGGGREGGREGGQRK